LKGGTLIEDRSRDFDIQAYSTDPSYLSAPNRPLVIQPIDSIFRGENYGPGKFVFIPTSTFSGKYDGSQNLNAYYLMLDIPFELFAQSFRLVGGARLENSRIRVTSPKAIDDPTIITSNLNKIDLLPSINLTYIVNDFTNVRLAHYQSVNRPELRELAGVLYLDFNQDRNVIGNSSLQRAYVHNYDLRVELFPGIGEVVAGSFFYKSLYNAIEERLIVAPDRYVQTWYNSPSGKNYGIELEARKTLGFLGDYFRTMMVTGNYTWITSEIEYTEERTDPQGNPVITQAFRPMQGQSPWTINLGLIWSDPDLGTSASILYNKFGRRLAAVGDQRDQDVYEEPRDLVDLSLTQRLSSLLELRFTMKNVFADEIRFTSGPEEVFYARYED
jgi:outer membrane receptor protein involved in Fe transport